MPRLPQELIEIIIGELDDSIALKSFSTTAHRLTTPSQRGIFLASSDRCLETNRMYEALQARLGVSPHLGSYILELVLEAPWSAAAISSADFILRSLPHLRSLRFNGCPYHMGYISKVASTLMPLVAQPSLRSLTLIHARDVPPSLILAQWHLCLI